MSRRHQPHRSFALLEMLALKEQGQQKSGEAGASPISIFVVRVLTVTAKKWYMPVQL